MSLGLFALLLVRPAAADPKVPKPELTGLLQVWATAYDMDENPQADPAGYGDPEDDIGVKIRRARVGLKAENDVVRYGLVIGTSSPYDALYGIGPDSGDGTISLIDGYVGVAPVKPLWVTAGMQKVPLSREALMSTAQLVFTDRAVSTEWLTPDRDLGVVLDGRFSVARVRVGAFNGTGDITGDDNTGKLLSARVEADFGPAGTYRTWGAEKEMTFGVALDGYMDDDVATTTVGAGADLILRVSGVHVLAEGRMAKIQPTDTDVAEPEEVADTTRIGALAQVGYAAGPWEPAVRFSMFDDDRDATDNGDVMDLTAGLTWHGLEDALRLGGGYVLRLEQGGATTSNDTVRLWAQLAL